MIATFFHTLYLNLVIVQGFFMAINALIVQTFFIHRCWLL